MFVRGKCELAVAECFVFWAAVVGAVVTGSGFGVDLHVLIYVHTPLFSVRCFAARALPGSALPSPSFVVAVLAEEVGRAVWQSMYCRCAFVFSRIE